MMKLSRLSRRSEARTLTEGSIVRALVRLSVPIVLANILQVAYQLTDIFWAGQLSAQALAAVSLSFPITFLMVAIGGGLAIAGSVLIAQYEGRGEERAMNHVTAQTLIMVTVASIAISAIGYVYSGPIMRFMGAEPDVLPDAARFMQITFIGFVFVFGFFVYQSLMRGLGVVQVPMLIVLLTVLLNFGLDPLFIFGWGPIPAMGVAGAAMATLSTQALAAGIGFTLLFSGRHRLRPRLADFRPDWKVIGRTFKLGLPASIEQAMRALSMTLMTLLVSTFGTIAIDAYSLGLRIMTFVVIPAMGVAMATTTLVAQNLGAGKLSRGRRDEFARLHVVVFRSDRRRSFAVHFCHAPGNAVRTRQRGRHFREPTSFASFRCRSAASVCSTQSTARSGALATRWPPWC